MLHSQYLSEVVFLADPIVDGRLTIVISNENVCEIIGVHDSGFWGLGH